MQSAVGWESRRAQGGEGKEPLKYFRGVAEEAMLELNGKPELCTEACLQRQGKNVWRKVRSGGPAALGMEECSCLEFSEEQE